MNQGEMVRETEIPKTPLIVFNIYPIPLLVSRHA